MGTEGVDPDAFDAFEAAGWDQRAEGYVGVFLPLTAHVINPLLDAGNVGPGTRVLDVASGPGHVAAACAARGATPIGLDVSSQMIAVARGRYPGLDFRQGDAQHLPFENRSLDAVVGNFAILHFGRPERAVAEFLRVLLPGGSVALSTWDSPVRARILGVLLDAVVGNFAILHFGRPERAVAEFLRVLLPGGSVALSTWDSPVRARILGVLLDAAAEVGAVPLPHLPPGPPFFRFAEESEFDRLLRTAGLREVDVRTVSFSYHYESADHLWDGMARGTVRTRALIFDQPEDILARIRSAYERNIEEYAVAGGGFDLPVSVKVASGMR